MAKKKNDNGKKILKSLVKETVIAIAEMMEERLDNVGIKNINVIDEINLILNEHEIGFELMEHSEIVTIEKSSAK